jgi:hypothetical protein
MAGQIMRAEIGFGFANRERDLLTSQPSHERPARKIAGDDISRPVEEGWT